MIYMGGKALIARQIVAAILADTDLRSVWYEPFLGGGNVMEYAAPHFVRAVGSDAHPDLIMMWEHVAAGGMIPDFVSREEYQALRHAKPSWLRGFVGFGASFGGKWFGGYGIRTLPSGERKEICREAYRAVNRQAAVFTASDVRFACARFGELVPPDGSVVYCDPPYAGTTGYAQGSFDYEKFYATLGTWARTCSVYVSEYSIPEGVPAMVIWTQRKRNVLKRGDNTRMATENLYRIGAS